MKIQYLGHSAFYVEAGEMKALIDPFIPETLTHPIFSFADITHIFITHGHGDHLGSTLSIVRESNATVITNYEISLYLQSKGVNCHSMHIGGRTTMDFGTVKMTPALHGSAIETDEGLVCGGNPGGFVIECQGKKLYHAGDTGLTMDMKLLAVEEIDVALLPIGGNFTMDVQDAVRAVAFIGAKVAIPMHYNTFPVITASPESFKEQVKTSQVHILNVEEVYNF
ncbi:beta-lactamase domain protein [Alkaliphilus metalliredigens QYMF]|uniref:UPF0173 metal-dependent hydrolase Amet_4625 n=1 Tax=Alkaliphilus metalliredigens (strain QYMF) TaxID=293826 RepID=Y4625_ALKMQ|nr:metal-dependent hydrolase [Alkaliphilus metalliredigens]A6TWX8.1 RecName: Full=UPF0173 metal-dependent hydrolase Amet_4625 [Alkaliphilus metalliredigens QYMF]ABR50696.1 beta-lactamase domain protein [Alkaliphilus metalliredigens QYMF]